VSVTNDAAAASGARALDPLDHFADPQHDHRRPNAPPRSGEDANDHSDRDDRREPDDLGPTEMDASGLRHRFIMPSADASDAEPLTSTQRLTVVRGSGARLECAEAPDVALVILRHEVA
jgi:hypothetical protein